MNKRQNQFRPTQDFVSEEMVTALLKKTSYDFNELFETIHARLRIRNATGSGKEMLRLRIYEKLQILVAQGLVKKDAKVYTGCRPSHPHGRDGGGQGAHRTAAKHDAAQRVSARCSPRPRGGGGWGRNRTGDTRIFSPLLYQLSAPSQGEGEHLSCAVRRWQAIFSRIRGLSSRTCGGDIPVADPPLSRAERRSLATQ